MTSHVTMHVSLATAKLFLSAFESDDISQWIAALTSGADEGVDWNRKPETELEREVAGLRKIWYHDGSRTARKLVWVAAARLRFEIAEMEKEERHAS